MPCSPGMIRCRAGCLHRQLVEAYRAERARQETAADSASLGYPAELADYLAAHPLVTFRQWLIGHKTPAEVRAA